MRIQSILALSSILAFSACTIHVQHHNDDPFFEATWGSVKGNGELSSEKRSVKGVPALRVSGSMQVEVNVGKEASVEVIADSNLLPFVHTDLVTKEDGEVQQKIWLDTSYSSKNPVRVIYNVPSLKDLDANGSGNIIVKGFNGGQFNLRSNGSQSIVLAGQLAQLDINANGSGKVNAGQLSSNNAKARLQGSGNLFWGM